MLMATKDLTNLQLNYAVLLALGVDEKDIVVKNGVVYVNDDLAPTLDNCVWNPSENREQGGRVIEGNWITTTAYPNESDVDFQWEGIYYDNPTPVKAYGSTPLIAGLKCLVLAKIGEEIDLPSELDVGLIATAKIKTENLSDSALDWAVSLADDKQLEHPRFLIGNSPEWMVRLNGQKYNPSSNPAIGYKIMSDNNISVRSESWNPGLGGWYAVMGTGASRPFYTIAGVDGCGTTMLEAAMRCYVAFKLGAEVDIPIQLLS